MKKTEKIEKGIKAYRRGGIWYDPCSSRNSEEKRTDRHKRRRHGHAGRRRALGGGGVMNYYDVTKKVQEERDADFLKAMKKNKHFWADPMSYPVRIEK